MLEKIEITDKNISRIANYRFKRWMGGNLEDQIPYIKREWYQEAEEMLADYNRVVDILNGDA